MNNFSDIRNLYKDCFLSSLRRIYVFYILCFLIISLLKKDFLPSMEILSIQLLLFFILVLTTFFYLPNTSINKILKGVFTYQLLTSIILRVFNILNFQNPLGYRPNDALFYHNLGIKFANQDTSSLFAYIDILGFQNDDKGFPFIVRLIYSIFGMMYGIQALLIFNIFVVTISVYFLYKLALNFISEKYACYISFIWGVLPFSVYTSSVGLKENILSLIIVASMYFLYKCQTSFSFSNITLFLFFSIMTLYFRTALFYMLLGSFLFMILIKYSYIIRRYIKIFIIVFGIISMSSLPLLVDKIGSDRGGVSYETITNGTKEIHEKNGKGLIPQATVFIAAVIGPFPSFVSTPEKNNYITLYNFTAFYKMIISFFFLCAIYWIYKFNITKFYPLLLFTIMHMLMLILTSYSLHDRYQWPHIPCFLIIAIWGMHGWYTKSRKSKMYNYYILFVLLLIVVFNCRM